MLFDNVAFDKPCDKIRQRLLVCGDPLGILMLGNDGAAVDNLSG